MEPQILHKAITTLSQSWVEGYFNKKVVGEMEHSCIQEVKRNPDDTIHHISQHFVDARTVCEFICEMRGIKVFSGDKVMVQGTKRHGLYETEVIKTKFGFTLKENKTVLSESACLIAIREVIGNIHDKQD